MTAHGTWVLTASGPYGRVHVVVEVTARPDGLLLGVATVDTEQVTLTALEVDGDRLSWIQPGTGQLPFELRVGLRVRGDLATGQALSAEAPPLSLIGTRSPAK